MAWSLLDLQPHGWQVDRQLLALRQQIATNVDDAAPEPSSRSSQQLPHPPAPLVVGSDDLRLVNALDFAV
jgi:hypothetical protein